MLTRANIRIVLPRTVARRIGDSRPITLDWIRHFINGMQYHFNCNIDGGSVLVFGILGEYQSAVMVPRCDGLPGQEYALIRGFPDLRPAMDWAGTVAGELWIGDAPDMTVREYRDMLSGKCAPIPIAS